jgi:serine protease
MTWRRGNGWAALAAVTAVASLGMPPARAAGPPGDDGKVLVTTAPGTSALGLRRLLGPRALRVEAAYPGAGVAVVSTGGRAVADVVAELRADPRVTSATPDRVRRTSQLPDDTHVGNQRAHLEAIRVPQAWDTSIGSRYLNVAVLDTGVDLDHPDLARKLVAGLDVVNGDSVADDDHGHGTAVAGVAAARTDNALGVAGIAWRSTIMPVKVLKNDGSGTDSDIVAGIVWAVDNGADVVNLSLGGPGASPALDAAVDYALERNVVVVAAAGNEGTDEPSYPAASPGAVGVGATGTTGRLASFSNYGDWVDLVAPGVGVWSTVRGGSYGTWSGTSFATPLATGAAVLVRAAYPSLDARGVASRLLGTTRDVGAQGRDPNTGRGLLDAAAALGAPRGPVATPTLDGLEPDGTPARATALVPGAGATGARITPEGDADWFSVNLAAPATLTVTVSGATVAPVIAGYDPVLRSVGSARTGGTEGPVVGQSVSLSLGARAGTYRFEVTNDVGSAGGYRISARTAGASAPAGPGSLLWVRDTSPATFTTGVTTGYRPRLIAARDLDPATVGSSTVRLVGGVTGREKAATVTYDPATRRINLVPSSPLRAGAPYVIRVRGLRDTGGATMAELYRFRFTVAP